MEGLSTLRGSCTQRDICMTSLSYCYTNQPHSAFPLPPPLASVLHLWPPGCDPHRELLIRLPHRGEPKHESDTRVWGGPAAIRGRPGEPHLLQPHPLQLGHLRWAKNVLSNLDLRNFFMRNSDISGRFRETDPSSLNSCSKYLPLSPLRPPAPSTSNPLSLPLVPFSCNS